MADRRVLHLIDTGGPGGAETVYAELVAGTPSRGWDALAVVPEEDWLSGHLRSRGVQPVILPSTRAFDVRYLVRLCRLCRREEITMIQAHLLASAVYGSAVGRLLGLPVVCTFHGTVDVDSGDALQGLKTRLIDRAANTIVFVSDWLRSAFGAERRIRTARTRVVHNGIDVRKYAPVADRSFRREVGVGSGEFLLGAIGNIRAPKGYRVLLEAVARLRRRDLPVRLVVVGDTRDPLYPELVEARSALGLDGIVEFTGFREDVPRVLGALDALVVSSTAEGFSLAIAQALASGVPVVSTRCGGPEEILEDDRTGLLVEAGSAGALAGAIERIAVDDRLRARLSRTGRRHAERNFSLSRMVERYAALYDDALRGGERPVGSAEPARGP